MDSVISSLSIRVGPCEANNCAKAGKFNSKNTKRLSTRNERPKLQHEQGGRADNFVKVYICVEIDKLQDKKNTQKERERDIKQNKKGKKERRKEKMKREFLS